MVERFPFPCHGHFLIRYPHAPPFDSRLLFGLLLSAGKGTALHDKPKNIRIGKEASSTIETGYCMHFS